MYHNLFSHQQGFGQKQILKVSKNSKSKLKDDRCSMHMQEQGKTISKPTSYLQWYHNTVFGMGEA